MVTSEYCQRCAKCCKVFTTTENLDYALRFMWMDNKRIKVKDTPFQFEQGGNKKQTTFKFPCTQLEKRKDGKYHCKVWDSDRPDLCNTYPDHIFDCCETWNQEKIKKLLDEAMNDCPGLKNVCVAEVIQMLKNKRGEE